MPSIGVLACVPYYCAEDARQRRPPAHALRAFAPPPRRVVLLHGPPGTGKTSLCKAIAQKLAIRLTHRFRSFQLLEINSHSLFSKWFSESGKLVLKMFQAVQSQLDDPDTFVIVLIGAQAHRRTPWWLGQEAY